MVFIIGVDHLVQYNGPVPEPLRNEFKDYLVACSRLHRVELIAEEFSREALHEVYHATRDTALEVADMLGIPHRYCDPEEADMKKLGLPYFADVLEMVRKSRGITEAFILDDVVRNAVRAEAIAIAKTFWHSRESFWYEQLAPEIGSNILFICGHEHTQGFHSLLESHGHASRVLDSFWRSDIFGNYQNIGLD